MLFPDEKSFRGDHIEVVCEFPRDVLQSYRDQKRVFEKHKQFPYENRV